MNKSKWIVIFCFVCLVNVQCSTIQRSKRGAVWKGSIPWPKAVIPYYIEINAYNEKEKAELKEAMKTWNSETCVNFRPASNADRHYIIFTDGIGCYSSVGMEYGNGQYVVLQRPNCRFYGTYLHELGHTIGLHHEHSRDDRDDHVHVDMDNVNYEDKSSYVKIEGTVLQDYGSKYDLQSIMHYGPSFHPNIITVKNKSKEHLLTQVSMKDISFLDAKVVNLFYRCSKRCKKKVKCPEMGFVDQFCKCQLPEDFAKRRCRNLKTDSYCERMKTKGMCNQVPFAMSYECRKSCNRCFKYKSTSEPCRDLSDEYECRNLAQNKMCNVNYEYSFEVCRKSCGFCKTKEQINKRKTSVKSNVNLYDDDCRRRMNRGECISNTIYMYNNCKEICQYEVAVDDRNPSTQDCQNKEPDLDCEYWASINECNNNPQYMLLNCARSCQACDKLKKDDQKKTNCANVDPNRDCDAWAAADHCKISPDYMIKKCARSCGSCDKLVSMKKGECKNIDTDMNCDIWAKTNHCEKSKQYMLVNCAKSCNSCDKKVKKDNTNCDNVDSDENCDAWAAANHCLVNPEYMVKHCSKSCKTCGKSIEDYGCRNIEQDYKCDVWAKANHCSKSPKFMLMKCAKSCGNCKRRKVGNCKNLNHDVSCELMARIDFCKIHPQYMLVKCARSCNSCSKKVEYKPCLDSHKYCRIWAKSNFCVTRYFYMKKTCKRSCRLC